MPLLEFEAKMLMVLQISFVLSSCRRATDMMKIILIVVLILLNTCADLRPKRHPEIDYAMAVLKKGKVVRREFNGSTNSQTRFRLASLTKAFTAMSALILEEERKLDPDDYASKYLPQIPVLKKIKIKDLIHHRSGLPYFGELCHVEGLPVKNHDVFVWLQNQTSTGFPPGSKYEYSNTGYIVLAGIISAISGMSYPDFVTQKIFRPLQMNDSVFHDQEEKNYSTCNSTAGEDGIYTTLDDYIKWTRAITTDVLIKNRSKIFQAPENYSYGWTVAESPDLSHYGSWLNYRTHARYFRQDDIWIIVLSRDPDIPMEEVIREATIWVGY